MERDRRRHLEEGDRLAAVGCKHVVGRGDQRRVVDDASAAFRAKPDALVEAHEMRRRVDVHLVAGRFERGAQECDGRAFAVRAGDMDHRRQLVLRPAETLQQPLDPPERQIDLARVERAEHLQQRVEVGHGDQLAGDA